MALDKVAPLVQVFGLKHFDEIDADHDRTITDNEMKQADQQLPLTSNERVLLGYMREWQSHIGHVIKTHSSTTLVWMPGGYYVPSTRDVHDYGITRNDLSGYVDRVNKM